MKLLETIDDLQFMVWINRQ